jgi:hypothetical protein
LCQKLLNLLKAFQNRRDCLWPAFKSGGRRPAHFSKESCSSVTCLQDFKTGEIASGRLSKVGALSCQIFKRELFISNLFARL